MYFRTIKLYLFILVFANSIIQYAYTDETLSRVYNGGGGGVSISNKVNYLLDDDVPIAADEARFKRFDSKIIGYGSIGVIISPVVKFELSGVLFEKFKMKTAYVVQVSDADELLNIKLKHAVRSSAVMMNMYYTPIIYDRFSSYISVGVGAAFHNADDVVHVDFPSISLVNGKNVTKFSWFVGAGCSYNISDRWVFDFIDYKFYDLNKFSTHAPIEDGGAPCSARMKIHSITAGIKMRI